MELAEIEQAERDGVHTLAVSGELDISNVGLLRDAVAQAPADSLGLVVDLSKATFVDSATVGFLFELKHDLEQRTHALRVVAPKGTPAERVLSMTAFDAGVRGEPTLAAAVAAIRGAAPAGG